MADYSESYDSNEDENILEGTAMKQNAKSDDEDVKMVESAMLRLVRWQDVRTSGAWLTVLSTLYWFNEMLGFPLITVLSLGALLLLITIRLVVNYEPKLKEMGVISDDISPVLFLQDLEAFHNIHLKKMTNGISTIVQNAFKGYENLLESDDTDRHVRVSGILLFGGFINMFIHLHSLLFILGLSVMIFPITYDRWHDPIEQKIISLAAGK